MRSSCLLAVAAFGAPTQLVGVVSFVPVTRREATENLFANRPESSSRSSQGIGEAQVAFSAVWWFFSKGFVHILYAFRDFETILWAVSVVVGSFAGAVRSLPRPYLFRAATKHFSLCLRPSAHAMWK